MTFKEGHRARHFQPSDLLMIDATSPPPARHDHNSID
jgi:hypothetical protein